MGSLNLWFLYTRINVHFKKLLWLLIFVFSVNLYFYISYKICFSIYYDFKSFSFKSRFDNIVNSTRRVHSNLNFHFMGSIINVNDVNYLNLKKLDSILLEMEIKIQKKQNVFISNTDKTFFKYVNESNDPRIIKVGILKNFLKLISISLLSGLVLGYSYTKLVI